LDHYEVSATVGRMRALGMRRT
jgi:hypothetical protein